MDVEEKSRDDLVKELDELRRELKRVKRASERNSAVSSLKTIADGIAHDLNNHLMVIHGNAEFCLMELPFASAEYARIKTIQNEATRAAGLCKHLLSFSLKGKPNYNRTNLSSLIRNMSHLLRVPLVHKVAIEYQLSDDLPPVMGNQARLRQVIMALVGAAADDTGSGYGKLVIETGVMDCDERYLKDPRFDERLPPGEYVYLRVRAKREAGLQDPVSSSNVRRRITRRGGPDSVLGIIHSHDGALKIRRDETGALVLTALVPPAEEEPPQTDTQHEEWLGSGTVLVVDDDNEVRALAEAMLSDLGFHVICVSSGEEAVEAFEKNKASIRLVLLDASMPDMTGGETMKAIRGIHPEATVILTSGYNEDQVMREIDGKPPAGFIQKPYEIQQLADVIGSRLSLRNPVRYAG